MSAIAATVFGAAWVKIAGAIRKRYNELTACPDCLGVSPYGTGTAWAGWRRFRCRACGARWEWVRLSDGYWIRHITAHGSKCKEMKR